ncbi:4-(cytidine 5'-diphospho)-2-C-methyl-D-erythritol kinase [Maribellus sp. CM-23]|uniref:4-(cytidine 5'-diphospho)-2-C-methyl-D-erythritol kinase n=1 Tax=Maribellus sp. CM-23 TaxID=2781026 RepID=UPI001F192C12|nr:4-(cytidine 5'-diphospho)-2-C-methyl-D-erythritol kinase [Maribellus sp. CM-23]MCE4565559.1 4-(cytidine 5'-diphospho)-2-C-methyl-D-erythritol kinase [Maribellus sp. CM-23]
MISFPNAKINIGLNVVSKREDGYHNLETVFYPVKLADALELVESAEPEFSASGIQIDGAPESNLVFKAYHLLQQKFDLPPVHLHLHKVIPFGAGLGGGSADAAFTLKMLNEYFSLELKDDQLEKYAATLGADCPFFIRNKPTFAHGIGDQFEAVELDLSAYEIILLKPEFSVGTADAFRNIIPQKSDFDLRKLADLPIEEWKDRVKNDFEKSVFPQFPQIEALKNLLYENGAVYASMSGSGSAVYGIFRHSPVDLAKFIPSGIFIYR